MSRFLPRTIGLAACLTASLAYIRTLAAHVSKDWCTKQIQSSSADHNSKIGSAIVSELERFRNRYKSYISIYCLSPSILIRWQHFCCQRSIHSQQPITKSLRSHSKTVYDITPYILKTYFNIFLPSTSKYLSDFKKKLGFRDSLIKLQNVEFHKTPYSEKAKLISA